MSNLGRSAILAGALGLWATAGAASPITLTYNGGAVTPYERVDLYSPRAFNNLAAGGFSMSDGTEDFVAWCIDLFDTIKSETYSLIRPPQVTDAEEADLNRLFTNFGHSATLNPVLSAAFQVSIWEIVYETEASYSLASGDFRAGDNAAVIAQAQTWLDNLGTDPGTWHLTFYTSDNSQDLVRGEVPLPAGLGLLGSALVAFGLMRRRRV